MSRSEQCGRLGLTQQLPTWTRIYVSTSQRERRSHSKRGSKQVCNRSKHRLYIAETKALTANQNILSTPLTQSHTASATHTRNRKGKIVISKLGAVSLCSL